MDDAALAVVPTPSPLMAQVERFPCGPAGKGRYAAQGVADKTVRLDATDTAVRTRLPRGALHTYALRLFIYANGIGTSLPDAASWLAPSAVGEAPTFVARRRDATAFPGGDEACVMPTQAPCAGALLDAILPAGVTRRDDADARLAALAPAERAHAAARGTRECLAQLAALGLLDGDDGADAPAVVVRGGAELGDDADREQLVQGYAPVGGLSVGHHHGPGRLTDGGSSATLYVHALRVAPADATDDMTAATRLTTLELLEGDAQRRRVGRLIGEWDAKVAAAESTVGADAEHLRAACEADAHLLEAGHYLAHVHDLQSVWTIATEGHLARLQPRNCYFDVEGRPARYGSATPPIDPTKLGAECQRMHEGRPSVETFAALVMVRRATAPAVLGGGGGVVGFGATNHERTIVRRDRLQHAARVHQLHEHVPSTATREELAFALAGLERANPRDGGDEPTYALVEHMDVEGGVGVSGLSADEAADEPMQPRELAPPTEQEAEQVASLLLT
jgi:hypothetical protein